MCPAHPRPAAALALAFGRFLPELPHMVVPYFEILAFTQSYLGGNPAGVCLLEKEWLTDEQMQQIAWQNNLAETAYIIDRGEVFDLRWFTPAVEVDLCGHATLASAHVLFDHFGRTANSVQFQSRSGPLRVDRMKGLLVLDFPAQPLEQCDSFMGLDRALRAEPTSVWKGADYFAIYRTEEEVAEIRPDFEALTKMDGRGVAVTAPGRNCDFVSRFFAPNAGIPEDPVTGSTHCSLIPFWSERLGKDHLHARQISPRGGDLFCENRGERVGIGGNCLTYVEGKLHFA